MSIYLKNKNKIRFLIIIILLLGLLIFIYGYKEPNRNNHLYSKCSFKPTIDTPSEIDLPIIVIDTNKQIIETSTATTPIDFDGTIINVFEPSTKYKVNFSLYDNCDMNSPDISEEILINIRGQSSILSSKKQYSINFELDDNKKNEVSILGLPSNSKWVLNGSYNDKSLLRNYLAYSFGSDVMDYSPRARFVEIFLNDTGEELSYEKHYLGVYLLIEKIERGKDRVNIKKTDDRYNDISFIITRDKIKTNDIIYRTNWGSLEENFIIDLMGNTKLRTVITSSYPSSNNITDSYKKKIIDYLNEFEEALYSSYFKDSKKGYRKYTDINSFVDYAMINEIFKNIDGGEVSTYFYKDIGGKLTAGPLWDFDLSLGNSDYEEINEPTGFRIVNTVWFNRLFQDPYFCKLYKKRYEYYRKTIWTDELIIERIETVNRYLDKARERNYIKWYNLENDMFTEENEVEKLKSFLLERLTWIDENINNIKRYEDNLD